jgi:DNA-binding CsgD family transcriptional regulator
MLLAALPTVNGNEDNSLALLDIILEGLIDGVIILDLQGQIVRANLQARSFCRKLVAISTMPQVDGLPFVVRSIAAVLLDSQATFPKQQVMPEVEIYLADRTPLRIRGQLLDLPRSGTAMPYVFITIEDRRQSLRGAAIGDAQRFGLTPREAEVWYLRLLGDSYRDIANSLYITENTVRKHIKNILAKRRVELEIDASYSNSKFNNFVSRN